MIKIKDFVNLLISSGVLQDCVFYKREWSEDGDCYKIIRSDFDFAQNSDGNVVDINLCSFCESPYVEVVYE